MTYYFDQYININNLFQLVQYYNPKYFFFIIWIFVNNNSKMNNFNINISIF